MARPILCLALLLASAGAAAEDPGAAVPVAATADGAAGPGSGAGSGEAPAGTLEDPQRGLPRLAPTAPAGLGGTPLRVFAVAGATLLGGSGRDPGAGAVLGVSLVRDRAILSETLELAGGETLLLVGGGRVIQLSPRFHLIAAGVGGLHATSEPLALLPAVGVRAELGWTTRPSRAWVDYVHLSVSGLSDLVRTENRMGETVGGFRMLVSATAGFTLHRGP